MGDQAAGDGGGEHRLAGGDEADGAQDLGRRGVLEQEAAGAGPQRPQHVVVGVEGGEDDHVRRVGDGADALRREQAVDVRACGCPSARRRARARRSRARPARRRPPRRRRAMSSARPSMTDSAARTSGSSSTTRTRITASTAAMPRAGTRPRGVMPCSSRPPASSARSASPIRPAPAPGMFAVAAAERERVAHLDLEPVAGPAATPSRPRRCRGRACARWSGPPARSGTRCARRSRGRRRASSADRIVMPAARDSSTSSGTSASVGSGRSSRLVAGHAAQHADHLAQVLEGGVRVRADHARRARDLLVATRRG